MIWCVSIYIYICYISAFLPCPCSHLYVHTRPQVTSFEMVKRTELHRHVKFLENETNASKGNVSQTEQAQEIKVCRWGILAVGVGL